MTFKGHNALVCQPCGIVAKLRRYHRIGRWRLSIGCQ